MKKIISILAIIAISAVAIPAYAQTAANSIAQEEAQGKVIYDKLQSGQTNCSSISDNDFELLGDYYMGQMMGSSHEAMDNLMTQRIGEANNRLMHIALGKRLSNCDPTASFPAQGVSFLPMMGMMGGSYSYDNYNQPNNFNSMMGNYFNSMMGYGWGGWGFGFGWIFMVLFWVLIVLLIVMLVRWITGKSHGSYRDNAKTPLEILKERYAKGEIDKKEFEDRKKDLI